MEHAGEQRGTTKKKATPTVSEECVENARVSRKGLLLIGHVRHTLLSQ